jgi:long-chain alkane monooxygenase
LLEYLSSETNLAFTSSTLGIDFSTVDLDQPIGNFETDSLQGTLRGLIENAPDKSLTFRQIVMNLTSKRFVGTPEQFAGHVTEWRAAGVSGINVGMATGMDDVPTFVDHVVPTLRDRGLIQREYAPGPLRHKLFGHGPRLDDRHPAARYRWPAHSASTEGSAAHGGGREGSTGVS